MREIKNDTEALDMIMKLVSATELDHELALAATVTIWRLQERGHVELSLEVLKTYAPGEDN
jgi:hypothetical protein